MPKTKKPSKKPVKLDKIGMKMVAELIAQL
jgi:hypothetical protein